MDHYERLERIDYKSARDVVTEADHLSEDLILDAIRARHPGDALLAEETGEHRAIAGEAPTSGRGRVWIVDPLDGTVNYANGIPFFCVSIGLVVDGAPAVGVIRDPTRDETFAAAADAPATLGGARIHASDKERLSDFVISMALSGRTAPTRGRNVRKAIRISRIMGSAALALAYVANGRFDAFVQQGGLSTWDIAAAGPDRRTGRRHGDRARRRSLVRRRQVAAVDRRRRRTARPSRNAAGAGPLGAAAPASAGSAMATIRQDDHPGNPTARSPGPAVGRDELSEADAGCRSARARVSASVGGHREAHRASADRP